MLFYYDFIFLKVLGEIMQKIRDLQSKDMDFVYKTLLFFDEMLNNGISFM